MMFQSPAILKRGTAPGEENFPLDGETGIFLGWSFQRLIESYSGPVTRLRRSSDSAEDDFGPDEVANGEAVSWVGASNLGYVVRIYDQFLEGRYLTQAASSHQATLIESDAVITRGGRAAMRSAQTGFYEVNEDSFESDMTYITSSKWENPGGWANVWFMLDHSGSGVYAGLAIDNNAGFPDASAGSPTYHINGGPALSNPSRNDLFDAVDGVGSCTIRASSLDLSGWSSLFVGQDGGGNNPLPYQHEGVLISSGGSVSSIESAMRNYIGT